MSYTTNFKQNQSWNVETLTWQFGSDYGRSKVDQNTSNLHSIISYIYVHLEQSSSLIL